MAAKTTTTTTSSTKLQNTSSSPIMGYLLAGLSLCISLCGLVAEGRIAKAVGSPGPWRSASLLNEIDAEPESICKHCFCHGLTVTCNFAHNHTLSPIWNSTYVVPSSIAAMEVQLTDRTQFQLHGGLFRTNRVNRFVVKGANDGDGGDQVELTHNAFRGNLAGLPDIQIIGVSNVFVREQAFSGGEIKLTVENSQLLVLFPSAFVNMNMSCNFTNIKSLDIRERAFNPSTNRSTQANVNLHIQQSNITQIDSFDVSMNKIVYLDCTIDVIRRSAFNVTNVKELFFENCDIRQIEAHAFTDKLHSEHISITGSRIGTIDSDAISGSGISNFTLRQNDIDTVKGSALQVFAVFVYVQGNKISHQGANWLHIQRGEVVVIEDNRFASFAAMQLEQSNRINCSFANNRLGNPQPGSLNFSNCEMRAMTVDRVCDPNCGDNQLWLATLTEHDISSELYCQLPSSLSSCFNATAVHLRRYENEACGASDRKLQCVDGVKLELYDGEYVTKEERERRQRGTPNTIIILIGIPVVAILMVLVILVPAVIFWKRCVKRSHQQQDHCRINSEDCLALQRAVVPRELCSSLHKLTSNSLSSEQCVNTIDQMMRQRVVPIPSSVSLVLGRHLQQAHAVVVGHGEGHGAGALLGEHDELAERENIYTEVTDYSSPQDSLDADNLYSEPNHFAGDRRANDTPPPAYAPPFQQPPPPSLRQQRQQLHHHYQQPDVLNVHNVLDVRQPPPPTDSCGGAIYATPVLRLTPHSAPINIVPSPSSNQQQQQRHVRELRENLEAMPQFHPNQLSSSRTQNQLQSRFASTPRRQHPPSGDSTLNRSYECLDGATSLAAMELMDMRGATALPPDSGSDHSGGSDETVKIDDVIEYADAEHCAMLAAGKTTTTTTTAAALNTTTTASKAATSK